MSGGGWSRIDWKVRQHPRLAHLTSATAYALYVDSILWASEYRTDGEIPDRALPMLLPATVHRSGVGGAVSQLVAAGLWERRDGGYQIHDYLDYQPSRAEIEAQEDASREGGRKGGLASGRARRERAAEGGAS